MRFAIIVLISICLSACKPVTNTGAQNTKLILRVEQRQIQLDTIREYRFFDSGLVEETIIYSGGAGLFDTKFYQLGSLELSELKTQIKTLSSNSYENQFPWQEDFYQRGDVIKFEYAKADALPHSSYYYTGHEDAPEVFKSIAGMLGTRERVINLNDSRSSLHHQ